MHPLILSLLDQSVDPAVVPLHLPERLEMTDHPGSEARNPGHGLQKDTSRMDIHGKGGKCSINKTY